MLCLSRTLFLSITGLMWIYLCVFGLFLGFPASTLPSLDGCGIQISTHLHLSSVHLDHVTSNQEKHKSLLLLHLISSLWLTLGACGVLSSLELYVSLSFWPCFWNFYLLLLLNSLVYLAFLKNFIFCLFSVSCRSLCHALPPASVLVLFSHQQPISSCFFLLFSFFCFFLLLQ